MHWAVATEILEKETASTASATPICSNLRLDSIFKFQDNINHIMEVLGANDLDCDDLGSLCLADAAVLSNYLKIVSYTY
ncbi:hypothetical protein ACS0TY_036005 [Phlomoides rotata]